MRKEGSEVRLRILNWVIWRLGLPLAGALLLWPLRRYSWFEEWPHTVLDHVQIASIVGAFASFAFEWRAEVRSTSKLTEALRHVVARPSGRATAEAQAKAKARTLVEIMADEFDVSVSRMTFVLLPVLAALTVASVMTKDQRMISVACVVAVFVLAAHARQAVFRWRVVHGYFGSSEHEVRELLRFALTHPFPGDFFDGGSMLPAFAVGERPETATTWANDPSGAGATP